MGGFSYTQNTSSPSRETQDNDAKNSVVERRASVTERERRPSFSDRANMIDRERHSSTCDDAGGRRDSLGTGSVCSDSTDGPEGNGSPTTYGGRRASVTESPTGRWNTCSTWWI